MKLRHEQPTTNEQTSKLASKYSLMFNVCMSHLFLQRTADHSRTEQNSGSSHIRLSCLRALTVLLFYLTFLFLMYEV
jgi:hypothetical protein